MTSAAPGVALAPRVTLGGKPLPTGLDGALVSLRVVRCLRTSAWARLELAVDDPARVLHHDKGVTALEVGDALVIAGRPSDRPTVAAIFEGAVSRVEVLRGERGGTRLVVTAQDASTKLVSESARTFVNLTLQGIVEKVVEGAGTTPTISGLPGARVPYMLQAGSALRFIDDVAQRTGSDWTFVGPTLHVWPAGTRRPGAEHTTLRAEETSRCEVSQESGGPTEAVVTSWDPDDGRAVTATHTQPAFPRSDPRERVVLDSSSYPRDQEEARQIAKARLAGTGPVTARVLVRRLVPLEPGATLAVSDAWWPEDAGYVREVTTTWDRTGWSTEAVTGSRAHTTLADLGGRGRRGTDAGAAAYTHDGVVVGIVTALGTTRDDDGRGLGRVKVTFPFLDSQITSDWARVAAAGAGKGYGLHVMPEIDDEVLVAFEGSDVRRPVVIAGLYSKNRAPAGAEVVAKDQVSRRALTSRSGNVVELVDGESTRDHHVLLALAGGESRLRLAGDAVDLTVPERTPVKIQAGSTRIVLGDDGSVTVEGASIKIRADQKLALEAPEISIKAQAKVAIEGSEVSVKGQAKAALEAGGLTQVKGGMVQIN